MDHLLNALGANKHIVGERTLRKGKSFRSPRSPPAPPSSPVPLCSKNSAVVQTCASTSSSPLEFSTHCNLASVLTSPVKMLSGQQVTSHRSKHQILSCFSHQTWQHLLRPPPSFARLPRIQTLYSFQGPAQDCFCLTNPKETSLFSCLTLPGTHTFQLPRQEPTPPFHRQPPFTNDHCSQIYSSFQVQIK